MNTLDIVGAYLESKKFIITKPIEERVIARQGGRRGWLKMSYLKDTTVRVQFMIESGSKESIFLDLSEPLFFEQLLRFARKSMRPHRHLRGGR